MSESMKGNKAPWIYGLLFTLFSGFGLFLFFRSLSASFLGDDWSLIADLAQGGNPFSTPTIPFFRPLGAFSLFLDYKTWGLRASGYHLSNILIHSVNAVLIVYFCKIFAQFFLIAKHYALIFALCAGLLFITAPVLTEPVSWISARFDLLATTWLLASLIAYVWLIEQGKNSYLLLSLLFFGCALLTKENVITYPLLLLFLHSYFFSLGAIGSKPSTIQKVLPVWFFLVGGCYLVARYIWLGNLAGGYGSAIHGNLRFQNLFFNLGVYTVKSVIPVSLVPHLTLWLGDPYILVYGVATMAGMVIVYGTTRPIAYIYFGKVPREMDLPLISFVMFGFCLLPVINLWPQLWNSQCDRFFYLPCVFVIIAVASLPLLVGRMGHIVGFASVILLTGIYAFLSYQNTLSWHHAGQISRSIIDYIVKFDDSTRLFVINLPDNINGAYVFRNSLDRAVSLSTGKKQVPELIAISFQGVTSPNELVSIHCLNGTIRVDFATARHGAQFGIGTFSLNDNDDAINQNHPPGFNISLGGSFGTKFWRISDLRPEGFDLGFTCLKPEDAVVYFSEGSLKRVECESSIGGINSK